MDFKTFCKKNKDNYELNNGVVKFITDVDNIDDRRKDGFNQLLRGCMTEEVSNYKVDAKYEFVNSVLYLAKQDLGNGKLQLIMWAVRLV